MEKIAIDAEIFSQLNSHATTIYSRIRELVDDEGISATYTDAHGKLEFRRWKLDYLPLTISEEQFATITAGITQRTIVLNLLLQDLYSEQKVISHGIIPPELIFCHRGFIRRAGRADRRTHHLLFTAADIIPTHDGKYTVFTDHTAAPSGFGYALAARSILYRAIPQLFDSYQPTSHSRFISELQLGLEESAPSSTTTAQIALYSPGVHSPAAIDIALVAHHLGITLVQAQDLLMRNGKIFMRSLGELLAVDILWHRLDPSYLDPLDLRSHSQLGVPGLIEATLRGTVGLVNHIGSSVLTNPALSLYWDQLCQYFLDENPLLDYVPTYWANNPQHLSYLCTILQDHSDESLEIHNFRTGKHSVSSLLSLQQRDDLIRQMKMCPWEFTAKEWLNPQEVPVGSPLTSQLTKKPVGLRIFSAIEDEKIHVMQGGLGQVLSSVEKRSLWNSQHTKDVWVMEQTENQLDRNVHRHQQIPTVTLRPLRSLNAPIRILNNMFWFGRYTERTERMVRLLLRVIEQLHTSDEPPIKLLTVISATIGSPYPIYDNLSTSQIADLLYSLIYDNLFVGSITYDMEKFTHAAREIWEQLAFSTAMILAHISDALDRYRFNYQLGTLNTSMENSPAIEGGLIATRAAKGSEMTSMNPISQENSVSSNAGLPEMRIALTDALSGLLAISGIISESLVRDVTWQVMEIGRRLERAIGTAQLIFYYTEQLQQTPVDSSAPPESPDDYNDLADSLLRVCDSLISFHNRAYRGTSFHIFLDLLLLDNSNPRSFAFQIQSVIALLQTLPETIYSATSLRIAEAIMDKIRGIEAESADVQEIYELSQGLLMQCLELGKIFETHKLVPAHTLQHHLSGRS